MRNFIKSNKLILIVGIFVLITISGIIGVTYSFFQVTVTNNTIIAGEVENLKLALTVTKILPPQNDISNVLIPQLDSHITLAILGEEQTTTGLTQGCRDANGNVVCELYKISLTNESNSSIYVSGTLEITAPNMPNLKWAEVSGTTNPTLKSSINTTSTTTLTTNEFYRGKDATGYYTKDYYVVVWISELGENQMDRGNYTGIVTFNNAEVTTGVQ